MTTKKAETKSSVEIVKKITIKSLCGTPTSADIKAAVKADETELHRGACILGYAVAPRIVTNNDTGETYEALSGDFLAYDKNTPNIQQQSATLYLPPIAHEMVKAKLAAGANSVEFAIEIGFRLPREGEKSPTGYIYTVKPLIKPAQNSPLLALLAQVQDEQTEAADAPTESTAE